MKGYEGYKESGIPWDICEPATWDCVRGKALFDNPKYINKNNEYKNVLSLTLKGVIRNNIENPYGLVPKSYDTYQLFEKDDLVFKLIDLENISTSRVGLVGEQGIMSPAYIRLVLRKKEKQNIKYYYYQYFSLYQRQIFNSLGAGVRQTLSARELLEQKIMVPPKLEQDKIVQFLDWKTSEMNRFIQRKKKQIKLLEELKQVEISRIGTKGIKTDIVLKNSGLDWLGEIPTHWELVRVRNNYSLQNGISESGAFFDKGTPFVNYGDVYNNRILPREVKDVADSNEQQQRTFSVKKGDIFFTRTSETIEEIGIASVCLEDIPQAVFSGFLIRARAKSNKLLAEYVGLYLQSQSVRNYFTKEMNLVIRASLGQNLLKSLYIPVPPIDEQKEIIEYAKKIIDKFEKTIANVKKEITLVEELRTKLISDVVTGQVDVRNVEIPVYETEMDIIDSEDDSDEENPDESMEE